MIGFWIVEALAGFIECIVCYLFVGDVLGVGNRKYRGMAMGAVTITAGLLLINRIQLFSVFATVYGVMGLAVCMYLLYKKNILDILVSVGSFFLFLYLSEFLLISLAGIVFQQNDFGAYIIAQQSWVRMLYVIVTKVVLIAMYAPLHKFFFRIVLPTRKILISVLMALGLVLDLQKRLCEKMEGDLLGIGFVFTLIVMLGMYLIAQYSDIRNQKLQTELMDERNHVMMRGYEEMLKTYNNTAAYYHDLKNHMVTLEHYLSGGHYIKATEYMERLRLGRREVSSLKWTGIEIIDFILSYKRAVAAERGIAFAIDTDVVDIKEIEETDLCALLGNMLDNALEGCQREEGEKKIHVSIRKIQEMLLIKTVNTCTTPPPESDGFPVTFKEHGMLHGWGMKSMKMIMEKYSGTMQYSCRDGKFSVLLTFFL